MRLESPNSYPRTYAVLKDTKNLCLHNSKILNAFKAYTTYNWSEISNVLSIGTKPNIIPVVNLVDRYSRTTYGIFDTTYNTESVRLRQNLMTGLEIAKLESTIFSTAFFMSITILHELVHYGRQHKKFPKDAYEYGWGFERDAVGFVVELDNIGEKYREYKNHFENLYNEIRRKK